MRSRLLAGVVGLALMPVIMTGATITVLNGDSPGVGFNDSTPVTPVGGNSGTTLGQQRMIAFQAAADKWGSTITSSVTIRVNAVWTALPCTANSAVLGSAGPTEVWHDFVNAPVAGHWYPKALANKFAGSDIDSSSVDITANFNVNLGSTACLAGAPFYLGLDDNHGSAIDLLTVVEHELAHGLGFLTFTNGQTGAQLGGLPSIWDDFLLDNSINKTWTMMTNAERAASAVKTGHLVWNGGNVSAGIPLVLAPQGSTFVGADSAGRALLYAPSAYQSGSSVSHFDTSMPPDQLMEPALQADLTHEVTTPRDLTLALLKDIGWTTATGAPVLKIAESHNSNFTQGQVGATYSITVSNMGSVPTSGQVVVTETPPAGLTITAMSGSNWSCTQPAGPCARSDSLAPGISYPSIGVTVTVAGSASSPLVNQATVSGGGAATASTSDSTNILAQSPPAVGPVTPMNGSRASATFRLPLNGGGLPLAYGYVFISNSTGSQNCRFFYDRPSSTIFLQSDAGSYNSSTILGTSASGSTLTLSNNECTLNAGQSFVSFSGNSATLNLVMSFKPTFAGLLGFYLFAANNGGANTGVQFQGSWRNPGTAPTSATGGPDNLLPSAGSTGVSTVVTQRWTAGNGATSDDVNFSSSSHISLGQTDSLVLSSGTTAANGTVSLNLTLTSPAGNEPAALQWTLTYPSSNVVSISAVAGSAATNAGKTLTCSSGSGTYSCVASGMNANIISNGTVAVVNLTIASGVSSTTLGISGMAASATGNSITLASTGSVLLSSPTVGPIAPINGSGASATFSIPLNGGSLPLSYGYVFITNATGSKNCRFYYDRLLSTIFLQSDAGLYDSSAILATSPSGAALTLSNNECSLNAGQSFVSFSGNSTTLNLALSFKPAFAGSLSFYLFAANTTANSGTQFQGLWTNPGTAPTVGPIAPINGSGASATFSIPLNGGSLPLSYGYVFISNSTGSQNCWFYYDRPSSTILLQSDAGAYNSSAPLGTSASGSALTLSNNECSLNAGQSFVSFLGNAATLNLALSFKPAFAGSLSFYLYAANTAGANSGTQFLGTWTNPGAAPTVGPIAPINGRGASATFSLPLNGGGLPLSYGYIFISNATGSQICRFYYDRPSSTIFLQSDAGLYNSSTLLGTSASGSALTLSNNECTLNAGQSFVSFSGNSATLNLALSFKQTFAGSLYFYLYAANTGGANSGTQFEGAWQN